MCGEDRDQITNSQKQIEYKAKSNHRLQMMRDPKGDCVKEFRDAPYT